MYAKNLKKKRRCREELEIMKKMERRQVTTAAQRQRASGVRESEKRFFMGEPTGKNNLFKSKRTRRERRKELKIISSSASGIYLYLSFLPPHQWS